MRHFIDSSIGPRHPPEAQLSQVVMARIAQLRYTSTAEALRELRTAFPQIPLAARVMALEVMQRTSR